MNMLPVRGAKVYMRMELVIPVLDGSVVISGDPDRVHKCMTQKKISIDVTIWKVNRVELLHKPQPDNQCLGPLGSVTLCVSDYICNDSRLRCTIKYPILVTFHDVPVGADSRRQLSCRMLWVMRGTIMCMHCHTRTPFFTSCDVEQADHRSICRTCYDLLYVREEQLSRKWQIGQLSVEGVPRAHFVDYPTGVVSFVRPPTPIRCLLKSNIEASGVRFLGRFYQEQPYPLDPRAQEGQKEQVHFLQQVVVQVRVQVRGTTLSTNKPQRGYGVAFYFLAFRINI